MDGGDPNLLLGGGRLALSGPDVQQRIELIGSGGGVDTASDRTMPTIAKLYDVELTLEAVEKATPQAGQVVLTQFSAFPNKASGWSVFQGGQSWGVNAS